MSKNTISNQKEFLNEHIESECLFLVPISMKYKNDIFREFTEEITVYMYPAPAKNISETENFINNSLNGLSDGSDLQFIILAKDSQEFLGCAGLHHVDRKDPEIGIWLKKTAQGKGHGKEVITAIKEWADKNLVYEYILYPVADKNTASREIPELLGGKIEREYNQKTMNGVTLHILEYRIYPDLKK